MRHSPSMDPVDPIPARRLRHSPRRLGFVLFMVAALLLPAGVVFAQSGSASLQGQPASCRYFQETGYSVCNGFLRYWQTYGGVQAFGYPLTDEMQEDGVTVQYFERARFEWHPGSDPARWDVVLGRLGSEIATAGLLHTSAALALLKSQVNPFTDVDAAKAAGWNLVPGLDYCMSDPKLGGMGVHYINTSILDTSLDPLKPEAMVYHNGPDGKLVLGAVEWIVPADKWDAEAHGQLLPEVLGHQLHLNKMLGVYVLHAWIFTPNPSGMFQDWNPSVTCSS